MWIRKVDLLKIINYAVLIAFFSDFLFVLVGSFTIPHQFQDATYSKILQVQIDWFISRWPCLFLTSIISAYVGYKIAKK